MIIYDSAALLTAEEVGDYLYYSENRGMEMGPPPPFSIFRVTQKNAKAARCIDVKISTRSFQNTI